jgi:hypothetical protein
LSQIAYYLWNLIFKYLVLKLEFCEAKNIGEGVGTFENCVHFFWQGARGNPLEFFESRIQKLNYFPLGFP